MCLRLGGNIPKSFTADNNSATVSSYSFVWSTPLLGVDERGLHTHTGGSYCFRVFATYLVAAALCKQHVSVETLVQGRCYREAREPQYIGKTMRQSPAQRHRTRERAIACHGKLHFACYICRPPCVGAVEATVLPVKSTSCCRNRGPQFRLLLLRGGLSQAVETRNMHMWTHVVATTAKYGWV